MKSIELNSKMPDKLKKERYALVRRQKDDTDKKCKIQDLKKGDLCRIFEWDGIQLPDPETGCGWFAVYKNSEKIKRLKLYKGFIYPVCEHRLLRESK